MTSRPSRLGWRLRALVQRHLAVHGGWYGADPSRAPAADAGPLLAAFLAARLPPGTEAGVERLGAELGDEWQHREVAADSPLGRITALARRLDLGAAGADVMTVLTGLATDRSFAWFARTVTRTADAVPGWWLVDVVDPAGDDAVAVAAAASRLTALGLLQRRHQGGDAEHWSLTAAALAWIVTGEAAPLPAGSELQPAATCARRDTLRSQLLAATGAVIAERRVVVHGPAGAGAGWIAAGSAARRGAAVIAATADSADAVGPALIAAAVLHDATLLLRVGDAAALATIAARLEPVPGPVVIAVDGVSPLVLASVAERLGASTVAVGPARRDDRAGWWRQILAEAWIGDDAVWALAAYPLPIEAAFELGTAVQPPSAASYARAAQAAVAGPLDSLCRRLASPPDAGRGLPPEVSDRIDELRARGEHGAGTIRLDSTVTPIAAAALCAAAGFELFELDATHLVTAGEGPVARTARVLDVAAERGAAVLIGDLAPLIGSPALAAVAALIASADGLILVPAGVDRPTDPPQELAP